MKTRRKYTVNVICLTNAYFRPNGKKFRAIRNANVAYNIASPVRDAIIPENMKRKQQRAMSDFRSWVVAGYLGCWLGCWLHGRRQGRAGGPSFAFRVPPFFSRLLRHIPSPCCGNHARVRACATATVLHAWARTYVGETAPVGEPLSRPGYPTECPLDACKLYC